MPLASRQGPVKAISETKTNSYPPSPWTPDTGKGEWRDIHLMAALRKPYFIDWMQTLAIHHHCPICRSHIQKYLKDNPIPSSPYLWFDWSVDFHNVVNLRTGKVAMLREDAHALFAQALGVQQPEQPANNWDMYRTGRR
jgi:hypothetical protein